MIKDIDEWLVDRDASKFKTDARGNRIARTNKFVNCNFRNADFSKAIITAAKFIDCDFTNAYFGFPVGKRIAMEQCGFYGATGMFSDVIPLNNNQLIPFIFSNKRLGRRVKAEEAEGAGEQRGQRFWLLSATFEKWYKNQVSRYFC